MLSNSGHLAMSPEFFPWRFVRTLASLCSIMYMRMKNTLLWQPIKKVKGKLTGNVLFFLLHLLFQVRQQGLRLLIDGEGDCVEVITGGLQSESVQGQDAGHRLAVRQRAERGHQFNSGKT